MSTTIPLMDTNDVARALRVSPHTVRRWGSEGKLKRIKLGTRTLFDPADVAAFVEQAKEGVPGIHTDWQPPRENEE
jgi:excisionase family DNA binding protein